MKAKKKKVTKKVANPELVDTLKKFNPEVPVSINCSFWSQSLDEKGVTEWYYEFIDEETSETTEYEYVLKYTTNWSGGHIKSFENDYTVKDAIELFSKYKLRQLSSSVFPNGFMIGNLEDGHTTSTIKWISKVDKKHKPLLPSADEMYENLDCEDSNMTFKCPDSIEVTIKIDKENTWTYTLDK